MSACMSRRSPRLEANGYYNSKGKPTISYKEMLHRVFRRRKRRSGPEKRFISSNSNPNSHDNGWGPMKIIGLLVFMLGLCFGFACWISTLSNNILNVGTSSLPSSIINTDLNVGYGDIMRHLRELQGELLELKMKALPPEADTWPNFALESQGAKVMFQRTSESCSLKSGQTFFGIPLWYSSSPKTVIQAHSPLVSGHCWSFAGGRGHLSIALSHPIKVTHVTLSHISKKVSPTGNISSAPKEFSVHGMKTLDDEGIQLGTFLYNQDGDSVQTFKVLRCTKSVFTFVKLQIESNWGHPDFSCLYSFRVHGTLAD